MPVWIETLIQSGVAGAVVVLLGRLVVDRWLTKELEEHKADLTTESQKEIEQLRAQLEQEAHEHRVRYSTVHERRAEVIAGVYGKLEELHMAFRRMTAMVQPGNVDVDELRNEAREAYNDFVTYYYPRAIWLERHLCDLINDMLAEFHEAFVDFTLDAEQGGYPDREQWMNARTTIQDQIPEAREELETEFRDILGVGKAPPDTAENGG